MKEAMEVVTEVTM